MAPTLLIDSNPDQLNRDYAVLKQQLVASSYWPIRQLVCQIDRDRIRIQGTVSSFHLKQVAQTLAARAVGIERVHSEIDVQPE